MHTHKQFYISFKTIVSNRFLVFKIPGLYCHELIFCKWVNLQKHFLILWQKDIGTKVLMRYDESYKAHRTEQVPSNRGTPINTLCTTCKTRAPQENIFVFFLQDFFGKKGNKIDSNVKTLNICALGPNWKWFSDDVIRNSKP